MCKKCAPATAVKQGEQLSPRSGLQVGDKVGYSATWLKSIAAGPTDELWFYRGVIVSLRTVAPRFIIASVKWNNEKESRVNVANLAKPGTPSF